MRDQSYHLWRELLMKSGKNIVLFIASTGVFFEALDIAIVNLAMPLIQESFQLTNDKVQWVQTFYILTYGGCLIIGGRLSDTIGRRKTFIIGNVLFLVTSLAAALSFRFDMLVVSRAIQGIGAGLMMPSALSIVTNTFTDPQNRGRAIGIFGAFAAIGSGSGMSFGGIIASWFGWEAVFFINVPVITITIILTLIYIDRGTEQPFSLSSLFSNLAPRSVFRIRNTMLGAALILLLGAFFTGFLFLVSMLLQNNMKYTAANAGLILFPFAILSAIASRTALPILLRRMSVHGAAVFGMMLMVSGAVLIIAAMTWNYNLVLLLISFACISGVGMAVCFTTLMIISMQDVPEEQHGAASGICQTAYFVGGSLGLAILSLVMTGDATNTITRMPIVVMMIFAVLGVALLVVNGQTSKRSPGSVR